MREAAAAKAARKAAHEAQVAAAEEERRKRNEERQTLEAKRRADPVYQAKQIAKQARRQPKWMKSVVVIKKDGHRKTHVRIGVGFPPTATSGAREDNDSN